MHAPLHRFVLSARQRDLAVQQPTALKAMRGHIRVEGLQNREAAQYRVAVMSRFVYRIFPINGMRPDLLGNEVVLRASRIIVESLTMLCMFPLHFLQEHDIGIQFSQSLAQRVQHHTAIEIGEALVNVVGGYFQGRHGYVFYPMDGDNAACRLG